MNKNLINSILSFYDFGNLSDYEMMEQGFANQNFRLDTDRGTFLLRNCVEQGRESIVQEMQLMKRLRLASFPTAYPVERMDGTFLTELPEGRFIFYDFILGEIPQLNKKTVAEIASAVATLNSLEGLEDIAKKNSINLEACLHLIDSETFKKYPFHNITRDFKNWTTELNQSLNESLPKGLVHGDVFPDNTFFKGNKLVAIIDFEEFAIDTLLFDVGMTIHGFCYINNHLDPVLFETFMESYQKTRKLSIEEKESLPVYIKWTALGMAFWHLNKLVQKDNLQQRERVEELLERVRDASSELPRLNNVF